MSPPNLPKDPAAALLPAAKEALYLTDAEGLIVYWPEPAREIFGYTTQEAVGQDAATLLSGGEPCALTRSALSEAIGTGSAFAGFKRRTRSGDEIPTRSSLWRVPQEEERGPWVAISERDISDIQRAEKLLFEELQQSEANGELLRNVLDSARDIGIIAVNKDGSIALWSSGSERLFACRRRDICAPEGQALLDRLTAEGAVPLRQVFERTAEQGSYEADFTACTKGGRRFPASITARPRLNRYGEPDGVIAVVQDLTLRMETLKERDAALNEARLAREAALSAAKTKSEFLANMSHEIRTPMNAVLGMLQLIQRTDLDRKQRDYAQKASSAAGDLLHIIDDILDFSKIEAGKLSIESAPFQLSSLLKDVGVILGANVGDKLVEVLFKIDPALPDRLIGDAHRLKQILINLSGNALKFTEKGEVIIWVNAIKGEQDEPRVEFRVSDTGIGMTAEQQERLFRAFSQAETGTTRRFGGTGLGLVISQRLVRLLGGEIRLESEPGVGSTFSFSFPLRVDDAPRPTAPDPGSDRPDLKDLRVLIVDDNAMAREIISELASSLGWRVVVAESGNQALQRVQECLERGESFDVAFVDWAMPGLDGWETIRLMKGLDAQRVLSTAIIMVTAHSREALESQRDTDQEMVTDYLVKPVTASDLQDAVINALGGSVDRDPEDRPAHRQNLQGMTILVVEDNVNNQQIAMELLQQEGAIVELADDGQQGVDILRERPDAFDAVLMDVQMPVMDGYTATRAIRSELRLRDLPIIAVTANVMATDREASEAAGMNDHIGKPYHVESVVTTLLRVCGQEPARPAVRTSKDDELPASPQGFDFESAYARLGRNPKLYAGQARSFSARVEGNLARAREFLDSGEEAEASRELHTLKGLAATLGAVGLASQIRILEDLVKDADRDAAELAQQLRLADAIIRETREELGALATALEARTAASSAAPRTEPPERVAELMEELAGLIAQSNMRALQVFEALQQAMDQHGNEHIGPLGEALNALDFGSAGEILTTLRETLP